MSYITHMATAVPDYGYGQDTLSQFYSNSTDDEAVRRKVRVLAARSGISTRHSVLPDYGQAVEDFTFFPRNPQLLPSPTLTQRMAAFRPAALSLSVKSIQSLPDFEQQKAQVTHLITVTCTGLFAPGLDIELLDALGLPPHTYRSNVSFMGCNAAVIALRQADQICRSQPDALVLVVCTELCTLHFQTDYSDDYLLANVLFADGSAAVLVSSQPAGQPHSYDAEITAFDALCIPNSHGEMAWQLSETGFIMRLSSYVGDLIKDNMKQMMDSLGLHPDEVQHWAVHPGGKKILDNFRSALGLPHAALTDAYQVLNDYGNMSSPTVLFVLKRVLDAIHGGDKAGGSIFAAAFGPGLTVETMQVRYATQILGREEGVGERGATQ